MRNKLHEAIAELELAVETEEIKLIKAGVAQYEAKLWALEMVKGKRRKEKANNHSI